MIFSKMHPCWKHYRTVADRANNMTTRHIFEKAFQIAITACSGHGHTKTAQYLALMISMSFAGASHGSIISGLHTTELGKTVALQGYEWLSLEHTGGLSRFDVEDGFTDNYGVDWAADEWRYATRSETETLLGSLWGGTVSGFSADNYDGADWFLDTFWGLAFEDGSLANGSEALNNSFATNLDQSQLIFGMNGECNLDPNKTCRGSVQAASNYGLDLQGTNVTGGSPMTTYLGNSGRMGFLADDHGLQFQGTGNNRFAPKSHSGGIAGSLLVRFMQSPPELVPEPTSITLFAAGLFGLRLARRRRS